MIGEITNHLWQSSLFVVAAALLALMLRKNRADVRYWVWLAASLKFVVPFSFLIAIGSRLAWVPSVKTIPVESPSFTVAQFAQPFPSTPLTLAAYREPTTWLPIVIFGVWACGVAVVVIMRIREWLRVRAILRTSISLEMPYPIDARTSAELLEPGVIGLDLFGLSRPVLLLPTGLSDSLTPAELEAVLAHELCHVRRRDNLTAALHMLVEALFWFHPFVWWIGARLLEERERACDEAVLSIGNEPRIYAQSILNVCKLYTKSPSACVSGVTGSNLKKRIEQIVRNQIGAGLNNPRKILLAAATLAALAIPLFAGALTSARPQAQPEETTDWETKAGSKAEFDAASIKQDFVSPGRGTVNSNIPLGGSDLFTPTGGLFSAQNVYLYRYITFAYKLTESQSEAVRSQLPKWANADRYDIEARVPGNPSKDQFRLMMQSLLAERFKLAVHWEEQRVPVFAFVLDKPRKMGRQFQLHPTDSDCSSAPPPGPLPNGGEFPTVAGGFPEICGVVELVHPSAPGHIRMGGRNMPIAEIAKSRGLISASGLGLDRPLIDKTGIAGNVDFVVEFVPQLTNGQLFGAPFEPDQSGPTFLTALKEQLGIKIEPQTAMVNVLMVGHIEQPSPN